MFTVKHSHITLSDATATLALFDEGDEVNYDVSFSVQNIDGTAIVYIGGSGVTSTDYGVKLSPGSKIDFAKTPRYPGIYAISNTNNSKIAVMRISR
jgi:hypothetical protein